MGKETKFGLALLGLLLTVFGAVFVMRLRGGDEDLAAAGTSASPTLGGGAKTDKPKLSSGPAPSVSSPTTQPSIAKKPTSETNTLGIKEPSRVSLTTSGSDNSSRSTTSPKPTAGFASNNSTNSGYSGSASPGTHSATTGSSMSGSSRYSVDVPAATTTASTPAANDPRASYMPNPKPSTTTDDRYADRYADHSTTSPGSTTADPKQTNDPYAPKGSTAAPRTASLDGSVSGLSASPTRDVPAAPSLGSAAGSTVMTTGTTSGTSPSGSGTSFDPFAKPAAAPTAPTGTASGASGLTASTRTGTSSAPLQPTGADVTLNPSPDRYAVPTANTTAATEGSVDQFGRRTVHETPTSTSSAPNSGHGTSVGTTAGTMPSGNMPSGNMPSGNVDPRYTTTGGSASAASPSQPYTSPYASTSQPTTTRPATTPATPGYSTTYPGSSAATQSTTQPASNNTGHTGHAMEQPLQADYETTPRRPTARYDAFGRDIDQEPAPSLTTEQTQPSYQAPASPTPSSQPNWNQPRGGYAEQPAPQRPAPQPIERNRFGEGTYVVAPNDNFWTISEKVYGSGNYFKALEEHNRERFVRTDKLNVGDKVSVPSLADLTSKYRDLVPKPRQPTAAPSTTTMVSSRTGLGGRSYMVREGDTLFDIARYELGKASRWTEIYDLNRDRLGEDFDFLTPGMTLMLPDGGGAGGAAGHQPLTTQSRQPYNR